MPSQRTFRHDLYLDELEEAQQHQAVERERPTPFSSDLTNRRAALLLLASALFLLVCALVGGL